MVDYETIVVYKEEQKIKRIIDRLSYLVERWTDEKDYEDFERYKTYIKEVLSDNGLVYINMSKNFVLRFYDSGVLNVLRLSKDKNSFVHLIC